MCRYRLIVTACLILGCSSIVCAEAVAEKQPDPYENTSVLVEAFMVRVSTEALAEVGVNPISQAPEGISILKILACLDNPEEAFVLSGTKVQAGHRKEAKSEQSKRVHVKNESSKVVNDKDGPREVKSVRYNDYQVGTTLSIWPFVISNDKVRIEFKYEESNFALSDNDAPPTILSYEWNGRIAAQSGVPVVAGATQDDDAVTFLILTATIQD